MTRKARITIGVFATIALLVALSMLGASCISQPSVKARAPAAATKACDPKKLETHVRAMAETFHPRGFAHVDNLDRAASYIRAELGKAGGALSDQPFVVDGRTYRNVILHLGPMSGPRIVVGAHYDAANDAPGADDDASGIAGLLELSRMLGEDVPKMHVELVAYTLEEPPYYATEHMGSVHHAKSLADAKADVRAMISLEMIGYFSDAKDSQSFPIAPLRLLYPTTGNFIAVVGHTGESDLVREVKASMMGATDLPVYSLNGPKIVQGVDWSDHRSYWSLGYHAVMITDTSFLRNVRYHTMQDTPDTLDYPRMAKVVEGTFQAMHSLAR